MNGFEKRKAQKKQAIITSTLSLYLKNGIKNTSIAAIASKAQVSQVTIFKYFTNKEQLTHEVISEYSLAIPQILAKHLQTDLSFPQKLKNIFLEIMATHQKASLSFLQSLFDDFYDKSNPLAKQYFEQSYPYLLQLLEEGRQEGYIRDDISNEAILLYIDFSYKSALSIKDERLLAHQVEIKKMFLYGIVKDAKTADFLADIKKETDTSH